MRRSPPSSAPPADPPVVSKTRRKQAMHDLQQLGEALVDLDARALARLDLPEQLCDAIGLARTTTKHEARRRQMQFVGRLMRDVDPEPIRALLAGRDRIDRDERAQFAAAEAWRERLLSDASAVTAFTAAHPDVDAAKLAALVHEARAERTGGHPPHRFRALFRLIERTLRPPTAPPDPEP